MRLADYLQYFTNLESLEFVVLIPEYEDPHWQCPLHPNLFPDFQRSTSILPLKPGNDFH